MELTTAVVLMCSVYASAPVVEAAPVLEADLAAQKVVQKVQTRTEITVQSWPTMEGLSKKAALEACRMKAVATCTEAAKGKAPGPCRYEIHDAQAAKGWDQAKPVVWPKAKERKRKRKRKRKRTKEAGQ